MGIQVWFASSFTALSTLLFSAFFFITQSSFTLKSPKLTITVDGPYSFITYPRVGTVKTCLILLILTLIFLFTSPIRWLSINKLTLCLVYHTANQTSVADHLLHHRRHQSDWHHRLLAVVSRRRTRLGQGTRI